MWAAWAVDCALTSLLILNHFLFQKILLPPTGAALRPPILQPANLGRGIFLPKQVVFQFCLEKSPHGLADSLGVWVVALSVLSLLPGRPWNTEATKLRSELFSSLQELEFLRVRQPDVKKGGWL